MSINSSNRFNYTTSRESLERKCNNLFLNYGVSVALYVQERPDWTWAYNSTPMGNFPASLNVPAQAGITRTPADFQPRAPAPRASRGPPSVVFSNATPEFSNAPAAADPARAGFTVHGPASEADADAEHGDGLFVPPPPRGSLLSNVSNHHGRMNGVRPASPVRRNSRRSTEQSKFKSRAKKAIPIRKAKQSRAKDDETIYNFE